MKLLRTGDRMHPHSVTMKMMAALASAVLLVSFGAQAAPAKPAAKPPVVDTVIDYASSVNVTVGKSTLVKLPVPAARVSVADPKVADIRLINPREVYLLGNKVGATNLTLWSKSGRSTLIDVTVGADIAGLQSRLKEVLPLEKNIGVHAAKESLVLTGTVNQLKSMVIAVDLANAYAGGKDRVLNYLSAPEGLTLESRIAETINNLLGLPDKPIKVTEVGNTFVLRGVVRDAVTVNKAVELAKAVAIAEKEKRNEAFDVALNTQSAATSAGQGGLSSSTSISNRVITEREKIKDIQVINFLSVSDAQQVMLEVKVAEVSKTLIDQLGGAMKYQDGNFTFLSNFLFGNGLLEAIKNPATGAVLGGAIGYGTDSFKVAIDAQKKDGLVRILAEPNIMAISGQDGEFHSGGKIFIPVLQGGGVGGSNAYTLEEKDFGIRVKFTPTVLEGGRINLRVRPEVSELNPEGTELSAGNIGTRQLLPSFTIRSAATTVQLNDGQSFAIGGLIKNNIKETVRRYPGLGEIPLIGALFRSSEFQNDKSELLFVVTPRLVKPLPPNYALPTDSFVPPTPGEFFIEGRMESKDARPQGSPQPAAPQGGDAGFEMK